jgi:hypothetical protein
MITVEKPEVGKVLLRVRGIEFDSFIKIAYEIKENIRQRKEVQSSAVKDFFEAIEIEDINIFTNERNKYDLIEICYKYLSNSGYDFSVPYSSIKFPSSEEEITLYHNLRSMLTESITTILNIPFFTWIKMTKNELIKIIYDEISEYNQSVLDNSLTEYSTYVITGNISANFGLIQSLDAYKKNHIKEKGYNRFLFDVVRNNLNAIQNKT